MTDEKAANESSLYVAKRKLQSVLQIYAPTRLPGRDTAIKAITAALVEFEAAVREDERAMRGHDAEQLAHRENAVSAAEADLKAREIHLGALRKAQANGTSGDQLYGADKEAMKRESAEAYAVTLIAPEGARVPLGEGAPDALTVPEDQDRAAAAQDAAPPVPPEVTHAALVAPELADAGAHVVTEPKAGKRKK